MANQFVMADFSEAGAALGGISGMGKAVKTNRYLSDVIKMTHSALSNDFDMYMDLLRVQYPSRYHHVYEWDSMGGGQPGRLWKHRLMGSGANRNASWEWVASKKAIPTPEERARNSEDPMSQLSADQISEFSKQRYFFYWKAPVMEVNQPVYITPGEAKSLAFPVWDDGSGNVLAFSKGVEVHRPGGDETTGAFTAAWVDWWASEAPRRFEERIEPILTKDLSEDYDSLRISNRTRRGTVSLKAITDYEKSFKISEDWMQQKVYSRSASYKRRYTFNDDEEL